MAEKNQSHNMMQVSLPESGEKVEYQLSADTPVKFTFFVSEVLFSCDGNDLVLTGHNGGAVVIKDYQTMAQEGSLPTFELNGGEKVPGDIYMFAFSNEVLEVETAAGGEVEGGSEFRGEVLPDIDHDPAELPDVEDSSSALEGLRFDDLIVNSEEQIELPGASPVRIDSDMNMASLSDSVDPIDDTIQQIIDSPEHL